MFNSCVFDNKHFSFFSLKSNNSFMSEWIVHGNNEFYKQINVTYIN